MSSNFPDDPKTENSNAAVDMTADNDEIFATPMVRMDGHLDEMPEGLVINPVFLPTTSGPVPTGIDIQSPDGTVYTIVVDNNGVLSTTGGVG